MDIFQYGQDEIDYLKRKDKRLGEAIDRIGKIERAVTPDLFTALIHSIVGQQISSKALATVWSRLVEKLGEVTPERVVLTPVEEIQAFGMSMRKASYIQDAASLIHSGVFDLQALALLPDAEVCKKLAALRGIGMWTAEMLMLFSMCRPDILSYDDLAIHRGMRILYRHKKIDRTLFERYRKRYSPYGSVASLYLWAIASETPC